MFGVEVYFVIHTVLFLCIFLDVFNAPKSTRQIVLIVLAVFITLFGGLRWQTGTDWDQYFQHFMKSDLGNIFEQRRGGGRFLEPGFVLVNASIKYFFGTFWMYNLITCGVIQFVRYKVSRVLCGDRALTCYCMWTILSSSYFSRRAEFAVGILSLCFLYIKERNLKKFSLVTATAYLVHIQNIIMFPFYWIGKIKLKWNIYIVVLLSFSFFTYLFQDAIVGFFSSYGDSFGDAGNMALHYSTNYETVNDGSRVRGASTILTTLLLSSIFLYVRQKRGLEKDEWYNALLNMVLVQTGIYMVFSDGMSDLCRLGGMFVIAKIVLMIESTRYFHDCGKKWQYILLWLFYAVYLISKVKNLDHGAFFYICNVPYKTIFYYNLL